MNLLVKSNLLSRVLLNLKKKKKKTVIILLLYGSFSKITLNMIVSLFFSHEYLIFIYFLNIYEWLINVVQEKESTQNKQESRIKWKVLPIATLRLWGWVMLPSKKRKKMKIYFFISNENIIQYKGDNKQKILRQGYMSTVPLPTSTTNKSKIKNATK